MKHGIQIKAGFCPGLKMHQKCFENLGV